MMLRVKDLNAQFFVILAIKILCGAEIDLFLPSFPELKRVFHITTAEVELLLSANLIAQCLMSLIIGNLGDKYGHKPIILIGLAIFCIGSIICVLAPAFSYLLIGRILQGVGITAPLILSYIIITDIYPIRAQRQIIALFNGVTTLAMACAPIFGSCIHIIFNWVGNFYILLIFGFACLIFSIIYLPKGKKNLQINISLRSYVPIIRSRTIWSYILAICFLVQSYWLFIALSPILYMQYLDVAIEYFGIYQGALAGGFGIISLLSMYLMNRFGEKQCFISSCFFMLIFVAAMLMLIFVNSQNPLLITGVVLFMVFGMIIPVNIIYPAMLEVMQDAKGRVAALFNSIRMLFIGIIIQLVSYLFDGTILFIAMSMCFSISIAIYLSYRLIKENNILDK